MKIINYFVIYKNDLYYKFIQNNYINWDKFIIT